LLGRLVRRRHWVALLTALVVLALYLDTIISSHTVLLEPFLVLGTLLGFLIVFGDAERATFSPSRWLMAGAVMGITTSIKAWEILPLIVLLVFASMRGRRCLAYYAAGAFGGTALVCAPFFFLAPSKFLHDVVVDQVMRSHLGQLAVKSRIWNLLSGSGVGSLSLLAMMCILIALCVIAAFIYISTRPPQGGKRGSGYTDLDACAFICLLIVGITFLASAEFYPHYGGFIAPFLSLVLSALAARVQPVTKAIVQISFAIAMLAFFGLADRSFLETEYPNVPTAVIDHAFSPSACVLSQTYSPLILSGRYNLFKESCPRALDIFGTEMADGNGKANVESDATAPKVQADWLYWLHRSDGVILLTSASGNRNLGSATRAYLNRHFSLINKIDDLYIYKRNRV
jgi:hypothetical protein